MTNLAESLAGWLAGDAAPAGGGAMLAELRQAQADCEAAIAARHERNRGRREHAERIWRQCQEEYEAEHGGPGYSIAARHGGGIRMW